MVLASDPSALLSAPPSLAELALLNLAASRPAASPKAGSRQHNPYAGNSYAWQFDEDVSAFLSRLKPSTTRAEANDPWIRVANPLGTNSIGDLQTLREEGEKILADLADTRRQLHEAMQGKARAAISKKYSVERTAAEERIKQTAKRTGVTSGKWMLFPVPQQVDEVWAEVVRGTVEGELGCAAKVAADKGKGESAARLICIYTEDFDDEVDVKRCLQALVDRGLVGSKGAIEETRGIYYKCGRLGSMPVRSVADHRQTHTRTWGYRRAMSGRFRRACTRRGTCWAVVERGSGSEIVRGDWMLMHGPLLHTTYGMSGEHDSMQWPWAITALRSANGVSARNWALARGQPRDSGKMRV